MINQIRRLILCLLGVLFETAVACAQSAPYIDHLEINDPSGRLTIIGNFGPVPGTVEVDSIHTPYTSWSSDSIVCFLPDSGRGSCGPVKVISNKVASNSRLLSMWCIDFLDAFDSPYFDGGVEEKVRFRLDLITALPLKSFEDSSETSTTYTTFRGPGNGTGIKFDTATDSRWIGLHPDSKAIDLGFQFENGQVVNAGNESGATLDQRFNVIKDNSSPGPHENVRVSGNAQFIPPDSELQASVLPLASAFQSITSSAYPIPANDRIRILCNTPVLQHAAISLLDNNGNVVMKDLHPKFENSDQGTSIDIRTLASGTYFYVIQSDGYAASGKFLVEH